MFKYEKFLQRPIKISKPNPRLANIVITQYGGANRKSLKNCFYYTCFYKFLCGNLPPYNLPPKNHIFVGCVVLCNML